MTGTPSELESWLNGLSVEDYESDPSLPWLGDATPYVTQDSEGNEVTFVPIRDGDAALRWGQVPYGVSATQYMSGSSEDRIALAQLGSEMETRDKNQAAAFVMYGNQAAGQQAASDLSAAVDSDRLAQEQQARMSVWASDVNNYSRLATASQQTTDAALGTLGMQAGLYDAARTGELTNTAGLAGSAAGANATATNYLAGLESSGNTARMADYGALDTLQAQYGSSIDSGQGGIDQAAQLNEALQTGNVPWGVGTTAEWTPTGGDGGETTYSRPGFEQWQDLEGVAQNARADQSAVDAQNDALQRYFDRLNGVGSLESQAAGARPDYEAVQNQSDAADMWRRYAGLDNREDIGDGIIRGEGPFPDIESREAVAYADPEAIAAQKTALRDIYGLTGGDLTATERLNMEQARRGEERDRSAFMNARLADLRERGMGGSGAEVSAAMASQQLTSENRMLQDMAAAANAQQRQERMLGQYAALGGQIRDQSFGEEARRGEAWDEMAIGNRSARMSALQNLGSLSGQMRNQSFGEQFQTGSAADAMALGNRDFEQQSLDTYADQAARQRAQSFSEQYQTGTSADMFAQFNATQGESQQRWMAEYNRQLDAQMMQQQMALASMQQAEGSRQWGIASDMSGVQRDIGSDQYARDANLYGTALDANQDAYARAGDVYAAQTGATGRTYDRGMDVTDNAFAVQADQYARNEGLSQFEAGLTGTNYARTTDYLDGLRQATADMYGREQDRQNRLGNATQLYTSGTQSSQAGISQAYQTQLGQRNADAAMEALNQSTGLIDDDIPLAGLF